MFFLLLSNWNWYCKSNTHLVHDILSSCVPLKILREESGNDVNGVDDDNSKTKNRPKTICSYYFVIAKVLDWVLVAVVVYWWARPCRTRRAIYLLLDYYCSFGAFYLRPRVIPFASQSFQRTWGWRDNVGSLVTVSWGAYTPFVLYSIVVCLDRRQNIFFKNHNSTCPYRILCSRVKEQIVAPTRIE